MQLKKDRYRKRRGDYSRLFALYCGVCDAFLFYYQKDGPGIIKRLYFDRIYFDAGKKEKFVLMTRNTGELSCPECGEVIGVPFLYRKEDRFSFRLFVGSLNKKVVSKNSI